LLRTEPKKTKAIIMDIDYNKIFIFIEEIFDVRLILLNNYDREMIGDKVHIKNKLIKDKKKRRIDLDGVVDVILEKY